MSDPAVIAPAGLVALMVAFLGPLAGPYAVILVSGLAGALWALSTTRTTRWEAATMLLRLVLTAVMLTGSLAWWIQTRYGVPVAEAVSPVAFVLGATGDMAARAMRSLIVRAIESWTLGGRGQ